MFDGALKDIGVISINVVLACQPHCVFQVNLNNLQRDFLINLDSLNRLLKADS